MAKLLRAEDARREKPVADLSLDKDAGGCDTEATWGSRRPVPGGQISTVKPEGWQPGSVDAIATASTDGRRIVIQAVNYQPRKNTVLVRLHGSAVPGKATATLHAIRAGLTDVASLQRPDAIAVASREMVYAKDFALELEPYSVAVVEIRAT